MKIDMDSPAIIHLCSVDDRLAKVISIVGEIEYSVHLDGYSFLIHEIIEQMLSVKVAAKIFDRFNQVCGCAVKPEIVDRLSEEDIIKVGVSKRKAKAIKELTSVIMSNKDFLENVNNSSAHAASRKLTEIYGIGSWTAKMYLIFVMNQQNILPYEDGAFRQTYKWLYNTNDISDESIMRRCERWKPYSSIGARYMYRALDMGLVDRDL